LQTSSGSPALAQTSMSVTVTSASPSICTVAQSTVSFSPGNDYTWADIKTTGATGSCTVEALAGGVTTGKAVVNVVKENSNTPTGIKVFTIPSLTVQNGFGTQSYAVTIETVNSTGYPASEGSTIIYASLKSSNLQVGSVDAFSQSFTSFQNDFYAHANFYPGSINVCGNCYTFQGTTTITASVPGAGTASSTITTGEFVSTPRHTFGALQYLFHSNSVFVVGDGASTREAMGATLLAQSFIQGGMNPANSTTDGTLSSSQSKSANLITIGYNNTVTTAKDTAFGIGVSQNTLWFNITAKATTTTNLTYNFTKSNYPTQSVAIVEVAQDGTRTTMVIWGYGWLATYAACQFMANPSLWTSSAVSGKHLLILTYNKGAVSIYSSA
jgi:hypothetical protein